MIGPENSRLQLNQSNAKTNNNPNLVTRILPRFKPVACLYVKFPLVNYYLLIFVLIDSCDYYDLGFSTLKSKLFLCITAHVIDLKNLHRDKTQR